MSRLRAALAAVLLLGGAGCGPGAGGETPPRLVMIVGVDVSGSFVEGGYFQDSLDFLALYLHAHLQGLGGLERPQALFVGPLGGYKPSEPKSFQPIQTFQGKGLDEIRQTLDVIFPAGKKDPYTDYNAFFEQSSEILRSRNLSLKPVALVLLTDGRLDVRGRTGSKEGYRDLDLKPLERFSRNVALRLLYTDSEAGKTWRDKVPRRRIKVWTQDAAVMTTWKDPHVLAPGQGPEAQPAFYRWVQDNVDFGVRARAVR